MVVQDGLTTSQGAAESSSSRDVVFGSWFDILTGIRLAEQVAKELVTCTVVPKPASMTATSSTTTTTSGGSSGSSGGDVAFPEYLDAIEIRQVRYRRWVPQADREIEQPRKSK